MDLTSRTFGIIKDLLIILYKKASSLENILDLMTSNSSLKRTEIEALVRLSERFGFIEETESEELSITLQGTEFVKHMQNIREREKIDEEKIGETIISDETSISITIPPFCLPLPLEIKNKISFTSGTMKRVVLDAEKELFLVTPFLDVPLIQSCFENVTRKNNSKIKILTSDESLRKYETSTTGNYLMVELRKLMSSRFTRGQIFFLHHELSIAHAKIFCSDKSLFITSANVKKDSISENFEAGIYTERQDIIDTVRNLIQHVIETGSQCLLDTEKGKSV